MEKELAKIARELAVMNFNIAKLVIAIQDKPKPTEPVPSIGSCGEVKTHSDK